MFKKGNDISGIFEDTYNKKTVHIVKIIE